MLNLLKFTFFFIFTFSNLFANDTYKFCAYHNLFSEDSERNKQIKIIMSIKTDEELNQKFFEFGNPWIWSQLPLENVRKLVVENSLTHEKVKSYYITGEENQIEDLSDVIKFLTPKKMDLSKYSLQKNFEQYDKISVDQNKTFSMLSAGKVAFACARFGNDSQTILNALSLNIIGQGQCINGLKKITRWMKPRNNLSLLDVIKRVITGKDFEKYQKGISLAAQRILTRVVDQKAESNLFNDLLWGFNKVSKTKEQAIDYTFDILAIYSTRGANTWLLSKQFLKKENSRFFTALASLATATNYLDSLKYTQEKKFYSYPEGVISSCDTGKPYHFWMTAYFTRRLLKDGIVETPKEAFKASFLSALGYQMLSTTVGREPSKPFYLSHDSFHNQKIRMDLAVHLAGAQFGANFYNSDWSRIKIDDILTSIRSKSQAVKVLSKAQALNLVKFNPNKFYNQWIKLMGIEEVFLSTYKQIKNK